MSVAYLRGMLNPGYPCGARSRMRENLVLDMMAIQAVSETKEMMAQLHASLAPVVDPRTMKQHISRIFDSATTSMNLRTFRMPEQENRGTLSDRTLLKLFDFIKDKFQPPAE